MHSCTQRQAVRPLLSCALPHGSSCAILREADVTYVCTYVCTWQSGCALCDHHLVSVGLELSLHEYPASLGWPVTVTVALKCWAKQLH